MVFEADGGVCGGVICCGLAFSKKNTTEDGI
jgi:hypothetical protein